VAPPAGSRAHLHCCVLLHNVPELVTQLGVGQQLRIHLKPAAAAAAVEKRNTIVSTMSLNSSFSWEYASSCAFVCSQQQQQYEYATHQSVY
jgi:hypothetical protein